MIEKSKSEVALSKVIEFKSVKEMPPLVVSFETTLYNKTGSWRYLRPVYHDKTAPCVEGCPAGEDVEGYMYLVAQGKFDEAWELILKENPFPAVCGRVCYHPCEMSCNRGEYDDSLGINGIERVIGDHGLDLDVEKLRVRSQNSHRVAVVGSGPSGLTCAYHLARLGYNVTVFEAYSQPGGVLRVGIPEYRLPRDVLDKEIHRIEKLGVVIETSTAVGRDIPWDDLMTYDAVYLASGVHQNRKLNVPGEELEGVQSGLEFLRKVNAGEKVPIGERVAIIGGGNTAMDAARTALRLGSKPTIFYRRTRAEMPAIRDEVDETELEGIDMVFLVSPSKIIGDDGRVRGLELLKMELGEPDESGRRRPVPIPGSEYQVPVDTIITAIGEVGDFSFLPPELQPKNGVIPVNRIGQTAIPKVFAGGDIVPQPHTVVHAIGAGKKAAMAIDAFLTNKNLEDIFPQIQIGFKGSLSFRRYVGDLPRDPVDNREVVHIEHVNLDHFEHEERHPVPELPVETRVLNFSEVKVGFTKETAVEEAKRCFNCGVCNMCDNCLIYCPDTAIQRREDGYRYVIDYDYCKGCGICVQECPRFAMTLEPEGR